MSIAGLTQYHNIFFIGIGGISMSGLSEILNQNGKTVTGSDRESSPITRHLEQLGISVFYGHSADHISSDLDLIVYTAAIKPDNVEYARAVELQIPLMNRATLLGLIMDSYPHSISVAGTHGKTTTTSMLSYVLLEANLDPTISVGGMLKAINGNFRIGQSPYFITEACEYTNSFHHFFPLVNLVLNIEADHLDFFKNLSEIRQSFKHYIGNTAPNGLLIINQAIPDLDYFLADVPCSYVTFGASPDATYSYANPQYDVYGNASYDLYYQAQFIDTIPLQVGGEHNINNSLAVIAASRCFEIDFNTIKQGLSRFTGANRRFEHKGSYQGATIIDDYAHHPTEISATLKAASRIQHRQLWVVFQPHTYTRTKAFFNDFVDALKGIDHLILTDIYAAREKDPGDIHSQMIVDCLGKFNQDIVYIDKFSDICDYLKRNLKENDLLITMGAGNVYLIGESLLSP